MFVKCDLESFILNFRKTNLFKIEIFFLSTRYFEWGCVIRKSKKQAWVMTILSKIKHKFDLNLITSHDVAQVIDLRYLKRLRVGFNDQILAPIIK